MNQPTVQWELALQVALRRCMDEVVRHANADAALLEGSGMKENQIRNVLNVAQESRSLAVVANFVRYQLGRKQTGSDWRKGNFGVRVIEQIEAPDGVVTHQAQDALDYLRDQGYEIPSDVEKQVRYELMHRYLGYLNRAFVYGSSELPNTWKKLRQAGKGA